MLIHTLFRHNIDILHIQYNTIHTYYSYNTYTVPIQYKQFTHKIHIPYGLVTCIIQIQYINSMDTIQIQYRRSCIGFYLFELVCICLLSYVLV